MSRTSGWAKAPNGLFEVIFARTRSGTWLADARSFVLAAIRAASVVSCVLGMPGAGCVTQDLQFVPPPNFPPSVEVPVGGARPFAEIVRLRADRIAGGPDAGPIASVRIDVEVRDPDVDQELQYKVYVDYQRGVTDDPVIAEFLPPRPSGAADRRRRPLSFDVPIRSLREPGCHRIELLVSQRFQPRTSDTTGREPLVTGDLGTATWWVATQASEGDPVDMTGCP